MKMIDKRVALPKGFLLKLDDIRSVVIEREVGRGANCIVYDAVSSDSAGITHKVRIKELYPIYINAVRNNEFELLWDESQEGKLLAARKRYLESYKKNVEFRNTFGIMNSTVDSTDVIELNNTIYSVMVTDEGTDYGKDADVSLKELFEHVRAVACVLKKYHDLGYVHLDIKPENIFVIPETTEHVYLFDFDSVCKLSELAEKKELNLSFSEGFSAPEQMQGRIDKIGPHTDIYALGAVLFYKLFRRKPEMEDSRISATYSFEKIMHGDERYQPKLYRKLASFFHKTLSASVVSRWQDMDRVIDALDELIRLSDLSATYLIDTFTYNSACFVGRSGELTRIHEALQENQVLYLSGIGGIGKTELAKKYVQQYRESYDTVAFVFFDESIEHSICQDILINNFSADEEESEREYFKRIIETLKKVTTEKDLILIDNFDVEEDECLEELLQCPCKFLITTRKDFRDYNYRQINVKRISDDKELQLLFSAYNEEIYSEAETEWIGKLIDFVDGHTMTVELISKYLRNSECMPSVLYERFMEKSGVTNTEDYLVKQRKDRKMNSETVNNHLSILFDVFYFKESAKEIISSLSLFAGIRILKERFTEICNIENVSDELDALIKNGWIEYNDMTGKISLHQVIQDLIFVKLQPSSESCPHITEGMLGYVREDSGNAYERGARWRVFGVFAERLTGRDLLYAKVCLAYGKLHKVEEAIALCIANAEPGANGILADLYMKKAEHICQMEDMMLSDDDVEEYGRNVLREIAEYFRLAIACFKKQEMPLELLLPKYAELGEKMDEMLISNNVTIFYGDAEELDLIYRQIAQLYEFAEQRLPETTIDENEKEKLYAIMQKFYSCEDEFLAEYKTKHYGNLEKAYQYQMILDDLRANSGVGDPDIIFQSEDGPERYWMHDVTRKAMADKYAEEGNYDLAIEFYKKAYEEENEFYDEIFRSIAHVYLKKGDVDRAIECLKQILEHDKKCIKREDGQIWYSCHICLELIQILVEHGREEEAVTYANELIFYMQDRIREEDNTYALSYVTMAHYYLYRLERQEIEKSRWWKKCVELCSMLHSDDLEEVLHPFLEEYLYKEQPVFKDIMRLIHFVDRFGQTPDYKQKLVRMIIQKNKYVKESILYQITLLLKVAENWIWGSEKCLACGAEFCKEAEDLLEKHQIDDVYLRNKSMQVKTEIMSRRQEDFEQIEEIKKGINYYEIAKQEAEYCDHIKSQVEGWKSAAQSYGEVKNYEEKGVCLKTAYDILVASGEVLDTETYEQETWDVLRDMAWNYIASENDSQAGLLLKDLYQSQILLFLKSAEKEEKALYVERIKNIAWYFEQAKLDEERFFSYLAALYMLTVPRPKEDVLRGMLNAKANMEEICAELLSYISDVNPELVDEIIRVRQDLSKGEGTVYKEKISPVLEFIAGHYENTEVEFK